MAKKKVFVSFDYANDKSWTNFKIAKSKTNGNKLVTIKIIMMNNIPLSV